MVAGCEFVKRLCYQLQDKHTHITQINTKSRVICLSLVWFGLVDSADDVVLEWSLSLSVSVSSDFPSVHFPSVNLWYVSTLIVIVSVLNVSYSESFFLVF